MITDATFRADYPEFASTVTYPKLQVAYWTAVAGMLLRPERWGDGSTVASSPPTTMLDVATELFVAHELVLGKQAADAAARGGTPGVSKGPIASDSVGAVSRSYATAEALEEGAGNWNLTVYGTRLYRLMMLFGAGPVEVGVGRAPFGTVVMDGVAWAGPPPWPGQSSFG